MNLDGAVPRTKLNSVVCNYYPVMLFGDSRDIPVLPLAKTQMNDMCGFEASPMSYLWQFH